VPSRQVGVPNVHGAQSRHVVLLRCMRARPSRPCQHALLIRALCLPHSVNGFLFAVFGGCCRGHRRQQRIKKNLQGEKGSKIHARRRRENAAVVPAIGEQHTVPVVMKQDLRNRKNDKLIKMTIFCFLISYISGRNVY
jgi:hypothetical protein